MVRLTTSCRGWSGERIAPEPGRRCELATSGSRARVRAADSFSRHFAWSAFLISAGLAFASAITLALISRTSAPKPAADRPKAAEDLFLIFIFLPRQVLWVPVLWAPHKGLPRPIFLIKPSPLSWARRSELPRDGNTQLGGGVS